MRFQLEMNLTRPFRTTQEVSNVGDSCMFVVVKMVRVNVQHRTKRPQKRVCVAASPSLSGLLEGLVRKRRREEKRRKEQMQNPIQVKTVLLTKGCLRRLNITIVLGNWRRRRRRINQKGMEPKAIEGIKDEGNRRKNPSGLSLEKDDFFSFIASFIISCKSFYQTFLFTELLLPATKYSLHTLLTQRWLNSMSGSRTFFFIRYLLLRDFLYDWDEVWLKWKKSWRVCKFEGFFKILPWLITEQLLVTARLIFRMRDLSQKPFSAINPCNQVWESLIDFKATA